MTRQTYTGTLELMHCGECGVPFGLDYWFMQERQRDHKTFYCPNGHRRFFPHESDIEREKRLRIQAEARAAQSEDRAQMEARRRAAARGQLTRLKNRAENGVCIHCNRTFPNLADHMATKHRDKKGDDE